MTAEDQHTSARDRRDLALGARQILSGFVVRMIARVLLIVIVAKLFGVDVFGRLGETVAIIELAAAFASFGLPKTLLGELAQQGNSRAEFGRRLCQAFLLVSVASVLIAAVLWMVWPTIFPNVLAVPRSIVVAVPLIALTELALTVTRHFRTVAWDTIVKAVVKPWSFLVFALIAHGLSAGHLGVLMPALSPLTALIYAYLGSVVISIAIASIAMVRMVGLDFVRRVSVADTFSLARRSFPIALNETGVFAFRRIDIIILGLVAGPAATGVYYLAQQIGTVVEKVRYLFEPMLAPIVAQSQSLTVVGDHLRRLCLFVFAVQLGLLTLAFVVGGDLLAWFGNGFAIGTGVLALVLVGELVDGSFGLCELPLVYRRPEWPPRIVLVALGVECVLVWTLGHQFGAIGAAAGFAAAMALLSLMRLILISRVMKIQVLTVSYGVLVLAAAFSVLAAVVVKTIGPNDWFTYFLAVISCGVIYAAVAFKTVNQYETRNLACTEKSD